MSATGKSEKVAVARPPANCGLVEPFSRVGPEEVAMRSAPVTTPAAATPRMM